MEESRRESEHAQLRSFVNEAEAGLRKGMDVLSEWGGHAKNLMERQPMAALAGAAVLGFVTGLLLRRAFVDEERKSS